MEKRRLGKTEHMSSVVTFCGTALNVAGLYAVITEYAMVVVLKS